MSGIDLSKIQDERAIEDIQELNDRIADFNSGNVDEEKFRSFRLARGVYGQRQEGVQMIRIKLPYGRVTPEQLTRIADIADKYATEKMHATTRQDIQIHYVKLADSPKVWAELEEKGVTLKEACGNTVRNVTAAPIAGIDPEEPFDVTPYAHTLFKYFLRNPICQEMGRKFKISFSSNETDNGLGFMHDLGFIPRIQDGVKGFKVLIAGGLGAQPFLAHTAHEFLPGNQMIPFAEAVIRVFDRYGERASRGKARMKFLMKNLGFEEFMKLVEAEKTAVINKVVEVDESLSDTISIPERTDFPTEEPKDAELYKHWLATNCFEQKQKGYYSVSVKLLLGNIFNETARKFADLVSEGYASDDMRVTVNQGFVLRYTPEAALIPFFNRLYELDLVDPGFDSTADIIACPGTDTCNLGIASSTGIARELERVMKEEFHDLIYNNDIKIKISGCMNACGQHNIANIGFQGMSIKKGPLVMPAMQVLLGGGFDKDNNPSVADKVVKVPSKRVPEAFRGLLADFDDNKQDGEYFNNYYRRQVEADKMYFFQLLKPYTTVEDAPEDFFVDWGTNDQYVKEVGVGECAGVILDLVGTLIGEAEEKFAWAVKARERGSWQDSIYHAYNTFVVGAKALLIGEGVQCNTQISIIRDFDEKFVKTGLISLDGVTSFEDHVTKLNKNEPSPEFAEQFFNEAHCFIQAVKEARTAQVARLEKETA